MLFCLAYHELTDIYLWGGYSSMWQQLLRLIAGKQMPSKAKAMWYIFNVLGVQ